MWQILAGTLKQYAGTSGTVTLGAGEIIILVIAHASAGGATAVILGGPTIPVINGAQPLVIQNYHSLQQVNPTSNTVVFTGTDMYYVQSVKQGNA